jgi:hypothetical protein
MASRVVRVAQATALVLVTSLQSVGAAGAASDEPAVESPKRPGSSVLSRSASDPARGAVGVSGSLTPNQLTAGRTLTREEAAAACGPAAAVAFARARGREVTLDAAVALAREVGWTPQRGMAGPSSQVDLLRRLQIPARLEEGVDRSKIVRELQAGRPVIIRTAGARGHYLVIERYDASNGTFDFGQSALVLKGADGDRWLSLGEIPSLGVGTPTHAIYMDTAVVALSQPGVTAISARPSTTAPTAQRVIDTGGPNARLRAEPSIEATIVESVQDGTRVTDLGGEVVAGGRTLRRVTGPGGSTAWIDASLLLPIGSASTGR